MADIVELTRPDNVELLPGAVQNFPDLGSPAATPEVLQRLVLDRLDGVATCLIAGPHDPGLVAQIVDAVGSVTLVLRSIVDAAGAGAAHPGVRVLCGDGPAALAAAGTFDLVVSLDDVTRLHSLEADEASWLQLATALAGCVAPGGSALFAVENDLGLHRLGAAQNPATRDDDGDWTPLSTWDATRPRTRDQLLDALATLGLGGDVAEAFGTFREVEALAHGLDAAGAELLGVASALVTRPAFPARSAALAGRLREHCAGWVCTLSGTGSVRPPAPSTDATPRIDLATVSFRVGDAGVLRVTTDGTTSLTPPAPAASLFTRLAVACTDDDLPEVRRLLGAWRASLDARARDGVLAADDADARFTNTIAAEPFATLRPGAAPRPVAEAAWAAIGDFYALARTEGVRLPWPPTMHPRTILEALGAAAGLEPPADIERYLAPLPAEPATREDLVAAVQRLQRENEGAWNRFLWGEQRYALDRAVRLGRKAVTKGVRDAGKLVDRVRGRAPHDAAPDGPRP